MNKNAKNIKKKQNENVAATDEVSESASAIEAQYEQAMKEVGRPLTCNIVMSDLFVDSDECVELAVHEFKKTVSYMMNDRTISYKTLTHALKSGNIKYGLACGSDGNCELYELSRDRKARTRLVASTRPAKRIIDPMLAFKSGNFLYVVFNIPTQSAIDRGVKGRKPVFCEDGSVAASGAPYVLRFDVESGEVSYTSPRIMVMSYYVCAFANDPTSNMPELIVANVLAADETKQDAHPSLHELWERFFGEGANNKPSVKKHVPLGVSVLKMKDKAKYVPVPMSGDEEYGVVSVSFTSSPDNEINEINFLVGIDDEILLDVSELTELDEIAKQNLKAQEAPCAGDMKESKNEKSQFGNHDENGETLKRNDKCAIIVPTADVSCDESDAEPQENGESLGNK